MAVLKVVADRLEVMAVIARHVRSDTGAVSVGTALLLAAINRTVASCSKRS